MKKSGTDVGGVAVLSDHSKRFIYNLVTKEKFSDKPTYETLESSLRALREHALKNGVSQLAMPKIGCGLDQLNWNAVRTLIKNVFLHDEIHITIYDLSPNLTVQVWTKHRRRTDEDVKVVRSVKQRSPSKTIVSSPRKKPQPQATPFHSHQKEHATSTARLPSSPSIKQQLTLTGFLKRKSDGADEEIKTKIVKTDDEISKKSRETTRDVSELPDIFEGWRVVLRPDVEDAAKLERYTIAFGGEILRGYQASESSHVIYGRPTKEKLSSAPKEAKHLVQEFLVDCIKLKEVQDENLYLA